MKKMFLTSSFEAVGRLFVPFLKEIGIDRLDNKKVVIIPTAAVVENFFEHILKAKEIYENLGMNVSILELTQATKEESEKIIENTHILHVSGGNTFFLLQELKRKKLDKFIVEKINEGMIYVGESAGTAIMSPDVEYVKLADNPELASELSDYKGLNLLPFYPVPHYKSEPFSQVCDEIIRVYDEKQQLVPITNYEAITVVDEEYDIVTLRMI